MNYFSFYHTRNRVIILFMEIIIFTMGLILAPIGATFELSLDGFEQPPMIDGPPELFGSFGNGHVCERSADDSIVCWGNNRYQQAEPPSTDHVQTFNQVTFIDIDVDGWHSCALMSDGSPLCWGFDSDGQASPPAGPFIQINAGTSHTCAVTLEGQVQCWGDSFLGKTTPPEDQLFWEVSAGSSHSCGLSRSNHALCWGSDFYGQVAAPEEETFVHISVGSIHSCGLKASGEVLCWGNNDYGQSRAPDLLFSAIDAGGYHTCGITQADNQMVCWGLDSKGQASPPSGRFIRVRTGFLNTCGTQSDCTVRCWGDNQYEQSNPPSDLIACQEKTSTLQVTLDGDGLGRVLDETGTLDCDNQCALSDISGTIVRLRAVPQAGHLFRGWSGDCQGNQKTTALILNGDRNCHALFIPKDPWLVTLNHFSAHPNAKGTLLTWETQSEHGSAGFTLWQATPAQKNCRDYLNYKDIQQLTFKPIPAQGNGGVAYSYQLAMTEANVCYGLEEISFDGQSQFYVIGPGVSTWHQLQ